MSSGKDSTAMEPLASSRFGIDNSEILESLSVDDDEQESIDNSEILESLSVDDDEQESLVFQLCHSDSLYPVYFVHMNSGRLKVYLRKFQRSAISWFQQ
uniref:BRX domain-containing protein n=1 Tax=Ascaris lumbricoides TaxID=6252 RepID=A0A0M3HVS1_ASCLU